MKKELIAGTLLILLLAASYYNVYWLDRFVGELEAEVILSRACMEAGQFTDAEASLRRAIDRWIAADGYTHIFIRHSEIDSATDAFYDLLSDVKARDTESAVGSTEKVMAHLQGLVGMERPTLGSIF